MLTSPIFFIVLAIVAAIAALFLFVVHLRTFIHAIHNEDLKTSAKVIWAVLSGVFIFFIPISPIPLYLFLVPSERKWRLVGAMGLISLVFLDGVIFWAHVMTDYNYGRSINLMRFFPVVSQGWTMTDPSKTKTFIASDFIIGTAATRFYSYGTDHKIELMILSSPLISKNHEGLLSSIDPRMTPDLARSQNIMLKGEGRFFIKNCPAIYNKQDHALNVVAGSYNVYITSETEPQETLEQLAKSIDLYELRYSNL